MMNSFKNIIAAVVLGTVCPTAMQAQNLSVKTNALYWATTTPNLAVETRLGRKWSLDFSVGYNPFTFSDNKKIKHVAVEPEFRYWLCSPMAGHFVGFDLLYSHYNAGGVKFPLGIFSDLRDHRYEGDLGAAGLVYGYSWMLPNKHWSIEGVIGLGAGYTRYRKYECEQCGTKIGREHKWLFMPTKIALNLVYHIK